MVTILRRALALALLAIALPSPAAEPAKCRLLKIAEWPVKLERDLPVIEGAINGRQVGILLDTGASVSLLTNAAAERLGLFTYGTSQLMSGIGGTSRLREARLEELRIGDAVQKGMSVRVGVERDFPGIDFILGDDFFQQMDVEFDYARSVIRLFKPRDCRGAFLAYWNADALQVPMVTDRMVMVPARINGRAVTALLDSGASSSVVTLQLAEKLGLKAGSEAMVASGCGTGIGADIVRSWVARFDAVEIGDERIRDARLRVVEHWDHGTFGADSLEFLLGTDFLRSHRVFVSRSQRKVYFSHVGGPVFPTRVAPECAPAK